MLAGTENRRSLLSFVTPYALKDRAAVTHHMGKDMDLGTVPGYEPAIVPDLLGWLQHSLSIAPHKGWGINSGCNSQPAPGRHGCGISATKSERRTHE